MQFEFGNLYFCGFNNWPYKLNLNNQFMHYTFLESEIIKKIRLTDKLSFLKTERQSGQFIAKMTKVKRKKGTVNALGF